MPVYEYEALHSNGKKEKGVLDAESESAARTRLRTSGKYPVIIRQARNRQDISNNVTFERTGLISRIKPVETSLITRQLATLIGAGIPLDSALSSIVEQTENPALKKVVVHIKESISEGEPLSQALQRYSKLFPNMYVNMVRAGEASGSLDVVLNRLADFSEKQEDLRARLKAAMVYPIFMAVIGTAILTFLVTYVVPKIVNVFDGMEASLPFPTVLLITISSFLQNYWWLLTAFFTALFFLLRHYSRQKSGKYLWDLVKLHAPVLGNVTRKAIVARFASTMESLLSSGVDIIDAITITGKIIDNIHITNVLDVAVEDINKGKSMAGALAGCRWFSPMFVQMVAVGETSGHLEEMLGKVKEAAERDVESALLGMISLVEPLMIVTMGVVVGLIVLSIMLPILEMSQIVG